MSWKTIRAVAAGLLVLLSCSDETAGDDDDDDGSGGAPGTCMPGDNLFCRCVDGTPGTKQCNDQGTGFGDCQTGTGDICEEASGGGGAG